MASPLDAASVFRAGLFAGRVAVITGGGSGIGLAIARELAALGATCVIAGRSQTRLDSYVWAATSTTKRMQEYHRLRIQT